MSFSFFYFSFYLWFHLHTSIITTSYPFLLHNSRLFSFFNTLFLFHWQQHFPSFYRLSFNFHLHNFFLLIFQHKPIPLHNLLFLLWIQWRNHLNMFIVFFILFLLFTDHSLFLLLFFKFILFYLLLFSYTLL